MDKELRILILEDVPTDAELLKRRLKTDGIVFISRWVDKKDDFLRELEDFSPDIIISDYSIPQFTGMEALKLVQELYPSIPLIIVTGSLNEETAVECMKAGAADYVLKDRLKRLSPAVDEALKKKRVREEKERAEKALRESQGRYRALFDEIIRTVALMIEMRDPYTAGHQTCVARLASAVAKEMKLSEDQIEGVYMAGIVHDLGKISVPVEILSNPLPLTEIQFALIKKHSQVGYDTLKDIEFPWPTAKIVLQHHERVDGSGYPQGLRGENILLEARILGVADVVEAMASHRPYRPALGIDMALEEITGKRGLFYDPEVVNACLKLFVKKGFEL